MRPVPLVVYGSFTCPYSYLASAWVDRLTRLGEVEVEWRAVRRDPAAPAGGQPLAGGPAEELDAEIIEVRAMIGPGGPVRIRRPLRMPDETAAVEAFADYAGEGADRLRRVAFAAVWEQGIDVGRRLELRRLGVEEDRGDSVRASAWRARWLALADPVVPALVLPTGSVRGRRDAVAWLAALERTWPHRAAS